jgi:uncharacterized peroxidase-related enzyme
MARIPTPPQVPGIVGLFAARPDTAKPLQLLAETLLRGPFAEGSTLSRGDRELIAAVVSTRNDCTFCASSHAAFASAQLEGGKDIVEAARRDSKTAPISPKMRALLAVAEQVQRSGRNVTDEAVAAARAEGATDADVHDTVLIAAAFCMFNRYVDGLAALTPTDPAAYEMAARVVVEHGYVRAAIPPGGR